MPELADVVRLHGPDYIAKYGSRMLPSHRRALEDILACRTPAMGGHVFECDCCGHNVHAYHSCRNRSCPKCHTEDTQEWIDKRRSELVGVPYFHVVFTVPAFLHDTARTNQKAFYSALMNCAARALMKLCADPRYLGGKIGVLAILHTWSRTLSYHPHVHCLVPAVTIDGQQCIGHSRKNFLVPVRALSKLMKGMLLDQLEREISGFNIQRKDRRGKWVVFIKPAIQGKDRIVEYLGRYVHRIAISNSRIVSINSQHVTVRYQDSTDLKWKNLRLTGEELLRRYLQHVLPQRFHKVRYYGLWAPANRKKLHQLQLLYPDGEAPCPSTKDSSGEQANNLCPKCKEGTMRFVRRLQPEHAASTPRAPP
jgi:hypothetical protein